MTAPAPQAFATIAVTPATQARFAALQDSIGTIGSDALVNLALDVLAEHYAARGSEATR